MEIMTEDFQLTAHATTRLLCAVTQKLQITSTTWYEQR